MVAFECYTASSMPIAPDMRILEAFHGVFQDSGGASALGMRG